MTQIIFNTLCLNLWPCQCKLIHTDSWTGVQHSSSDYSDHGRLFWPWHKEKDLSTYTITHLAVLPYHIKNLTKHFNIYVTSSANADTWDSATALPVHLSMQVKKPPFTNCKLLIFSWWNMGFFMPWSHWQTQCFSSSDSDSLSLTIKTDI